MLLQVRPVRGRAISILVVIRCALRATAIEDLLTIVLAITLDILARQARLKTVEVDHRVPRA